MAEIGADVVALQKVTLDRSGDLIGRLEKATKLQAIDGNLFARGIGALRQPAADPHPRSGDCRDPPQFQAAQNRRSA